MLHCQAGHWAAVPLLDHQVAINDARDLCAAIVHSRTQKSAKKSTCHTVSLAAASQGLSGCPGNHSQMMMVLSAAPETRAAAPPAIELRLQRHVYWLILISAMTDRL